MFCPDCGSEVAEGRKFCGKCGAKLHSAAEIMETSPAALESPVAAATLAPAQPASPRSKFVYVLVALLVVLGGVAWWWFHRPAPAYKVQDPGIYPFHGLSTHEKPGKTGFIDADGKVLIQPEWDSADVEYVMYQAVAFNEGLCGVLKDGKWGYIDTGGHLAITNQFDRVRPFLGGLALVALGSEWGYIDKKGNYVINPQFDHAGDFHDGLAAVHADAGWGFINKAGTYVIAPQYQNADSNGFADGRAWACTKDKCGYIDRNGVFANTPHFQFISTFSEGLAAVREQNKFGYIDTTGKLVINPQFDMGTAFLDGVAVVSVSGRQGTINRHGKYILNPGQFNIDVREGAFEPVTTSDGNGLITRDGKWVVKPSKVITAFFAIFGKVYYAGIGGQSTPIALSSGKVLAGPYKGAVLETLAQDIQNESSAQISLRTLMNAETSYTSAYAAKGFTASIEKLGPATGTPDGNNAGLIDSALATGTKDGYQFTASIPEGTSTGGTNFNYFIVAKPAAGHAGRTFCADSSGAIRYAVQGEECTATSPITEDQVSVSDGSSASTPLFSDARGSTPVTLYSRDDVRVVAYETPGTLEVAVYSPEKVFVSLRVDRNQNGRVDSHVDTSYGMAGLGNICTQYLIDERTSTGCGQFVSAARLKNVMQGNGRWQYTYELPKRELTVNQPVVRLALDIWNDSTKQMSHFPGEGFQNAISLPSH